MSYHGYSGQCIGRLLHFAYSTTYRADSWCFGDGVIYDGVRTDKDGKPCNGPLVATYTWDNDGDSDIPSFVFTENYKHLQEHFEHQKEDILRMENTDCPILGREKWSKKAEKEKEERLHRERMDRLYTEITGKPKQGLKKGEFLFVSTSSNGKTTFRAD